VTTAIRNRLQLFGRFALYVGGRFADDNCFNLAASLAYTTLLALVPLATMFGYSTDLRSRSQGRATYTMHFEKYEEAPRNVSEEVVARVMGKVAKD
jgi:uncharacterized BrkB/YihY/UPF0761 family membrane protein